MSPAPEHPERLDEAVRSARERRDRWLRYGERSLAQNLAMIGVLGWTVMIPTLAGIYVGRWIDRSYHTGIFWTLGLLVLGLTIGCFLAWRFMFRDE